MAQSQADIQRAYRQRKKAARQHTVVNSNNAGVIQMPLPLCDTVSMLDDEDTPPNPQQLFQSFGDLDVFCEQPQWYQAAVESIPVADFANLSDDTITGLLRGELSAAELKQVFKRIGVSTKFEKE